MLLTTTVDIDAPPQRVFDVTIDVERWAEWTPSIERIDLDGQRLAIGATAEIKQPGVSAAVWRVIEYVPGERFEWETRAPGVRMVGVHLVEPLDEGRRTHATLRVETMGLLAPLFTPFLKSMSQRFLRWEARGLKYRCEDPRYLWRQHEEEAKA